MKKNILLSLLILFIGFLLGSITYYTLSGNSHRIAKYQQRPPQISKKIVDTSKAFSDIVEIVSPAVVNISTTRRLSPDERALFYEPFYNLLDPFREKHRRWTEKSLGSGVIVSDDGYIITNYHVIEDSEEIVVTLYDRRSFKAKIIGVDPKTDLALIKIRAKGLPTIPWGDSDRLKVGEFVLAIGNPFGLTHTVTMGIISALGRANVGVADYEDFIQTDAPINPGNSGGPLVNIHGEIVGINTAIFSQSGGYQGIGFAVPSNMVKKVMQQLKDKGRVIRGWIGVTIQDLTPELAEEFGLKGVYGALVSDVFKGSPADRGGIQRGDIIVEINGRKIKNVSSLRNLVSQSKVGSTVKIKILRGGSIHIAKIKIAEMPSEFSEIPELPEVREDLNTPLSGITVTELTPSIAKQIGVPINEKGVIVLDVEKGTPAEDAGLKKGDIIQEIEGKRIIRYEDWREALDRIKPDDTVVLFINRQGKKFFLALKP